MRYFLVSYAFNGGFGRRLFGTNGQVNERQILHWEEICAETVSQKSVSIIAISAIDGPITPVV